MISSSPAKRRVLSNPVDRAVLVHGRRFQSACRHRPAVFPAVMVVAAAVLAAAFAPGPAAAAPREEAKVVLHFWNCFFWGRPQEAIRQLVEQFNRENPDIFVDILVVPQIEQKLFTATAGAVPPDVALFDRFRVAAYAERKAFLELEGLAAEYGIRKEDFFETCWDECVYRGRVYALPYNTDVRVLFWNRAIFREAGLDPDRPPRTWDELIEYSKKTTVRSASGSLERVGFIPFSGVPGGTGNTWLYLYGWQAGGEFATPDGARATLNDPRIVAALQWVVSFSDWYGIQNLQKFQSGFGIKELDPFLVGKMSMIGDEGYMLARIKQYRPDLDFGVAPLPWPEDGRHATWSGGFAMVIPTGCAHVAETMEFIRFMESEAAQKIYGEVSEQIPANRRAAQSPYFVNDPRWRDLPGLLETPKGPEMKEDVLNLRTLRRLIE